MANISIKFVGTGNSFSKKYGNTSAVVSVENNGVTKKILIDCGRTVPDGLHEQGIGWEELDAIFITHLHGDHVNGLEEAGFYGRYVSKRKPHLVFPHKQMKDFLWNNVLKGTMIHGDLARSMNLEDYFTYEIVNDRMQFFDFNDVMVSVFTTEHVPKKKSYGLIFGTSDYVIYTSDSLFQHDLVDMAFADGCQAIFHDCGIVHYEGQVHASLEDLMTIDKIHRNKVFLMHYPDNIIDSYYEIKDSGLEIAVSGIEYKFTLDKQ